MIEAIRSSCKRFRGAPDRSQTCRNSGCHVSENLKKGPLTADTTTTTTDRTKAHTDPRDRIRAVGGAIEGVTHRLCQSGLGSMGRLDAGAHLPIEARVDMSSIGPKVEVG
jgi:hypothetical protein